MRRIVMVSGAPGSGKSTLARPLAEALGFPLFSKDVIKERLADTLVERNEPLAWSKALGAAAMELIWTLAEHSPAMVLEANFRPYSDYERAKLMTLGGRLVEVYCRCPPEEAKRRYAERARTAHRHPIHVMTALSSEMLAEFDRPVGLGAVVEVDTTNAVDIPALTATVRMRLDDGHATPG